MQKPIVSRVRPARPLHGGNWQLATQVRRPAGRLTSRSAKLARQQGRQGLNTANATEEKFVSLWLIVARQTKGMAIPE